MKDMKDIWRGPTEEEWVNRIKSNSTPKREREGPWIKPVECRHCSAFFSKFSCGKDQPPYECDCPKCQGYCECD